MTAGLFAPAWAGPQGGLTVGGAATVERAGAATIIRQSSNRAIIEWDSFDVGAAERVNFRQPSSASITVNRIQDTKASQIDGRITANGNIMLLNPNGVLFGQGAKVDVGGLVASTGDLADDAAFLAGGAVDLTAPGISTGKIVNEGRITISPGGLAGFIAPQVENHGLIQATLGKAVLASGDISTVDFAGDGLIKIEISGTDRTQLVKNTGTVEADGGKVIMTTAAARGLVDNLLVNSGTLKAATISGVKGSVSVRASQGQVQNTGRILAQGDAAQNGGLVEISAPFASLGGEINANGMNGGTIEITAGKLSLADIVSARGLVGTGGTITLSSQDSWETSTSKVIADGLSMGGTIRHIAENTLISSGHYSANSTDGIGGHIDVSAWSAKFLSASLEAAGGLGGGLIRIGGEYQGGKNLSGDELLNAYYLVMDRGTQINADAGSAEGSGGTVILWSDEETVALGQISARPGTIAGEGGFVEISSGNTLKYDATVQTGMGDRAGSVLLDPKNIVVSDFAFNATSIIMGYGFQGGRANANTNLDISDNFGWSVDLDSNRMAVGAIGDDGAAGNMTNTGAVYLFSFSDSSFSGAALEGIIGNGYTGGKNIDLVLDNNDQFGYSVALDGNRLAVGAATEDGSANISGDSGGVYLFGFADSVFNGGTLEAMIGRNYTGGKNYNLASLGGSDYFGSSLALSGNSLAVGAYADDGSGNVASNSGAVYLFTFSDAAFSGATLQGVIGNAYAGGKNINVALDNNDNFGYALDLDGQALIVGAVNDDGFGNARTNSGAAYLFSFSDTSFSGGVLESRIGYGYTGGKNVDLSLDASDNFASGIGLDGTSFAIGARIDDGYLNSSSDSGTVYLFTATNGTFDSITHQGNIGYQYQSKSKDYDLWGLGIAGNDFFGEALALDGTQLIVGVYGDDGILNGTSAAGAVYGFTFTDTEFSSPNLEGIIGSGYVQGRNYNVPQIQDPDNNLGFSVALDGTKMAIGNYSDDGAGNNRPNSGAVYLYTFDDTDYTNGTLSAIIGDGYVGGNNYNQPLKVADNFGLAVSLDGNRLAVGNPFDDGMLENRGDAGAIFLYTFDDDTYSNIALAGTIGYGYTGAKDYNLTALDGDDRLGYSVSLDGNRLAAGALRDYGAGNTLIRPGAVYLFTFTDSEFNGAVHQATIGTGYTGGKNINNTTLDVDDNFGYSVSLDGNRLAVGSRQDDGFGNTASNSGAVYTYTFADSAFSGGALASIIGRGYTGGKNINTGHDANDLFGSAVGLSGQTLFIGAYNDFGVANYNSGQGAVYSYRFSDSAFSGGTLSHRIGGRYEYDLEGFLNSDNFGTALAVDGTNLVVAARADDGLGNNYQDAAAFYLFQYDDLTYQMPTLVGVGGGGYGAFDFEGSVLNTEIDGSDNYGNAVSLDGNRMAVGSIFDDAFGNAKSNTGAVYLYSFTGADFTGGKLESIIGDGYTGGKNINLTLENNDYFGQAVSLDGNRVAVGAQRDDGNANSRTDAGSVYLFTFSDSAFSGGTLAATIGHGYTGGKNINTPLDTSDYFGWSVALNGNRLAVGAQRDDGNANARTDAGSVYLYTFSDSAFTGGALAGVMGYNYTGGKNVNVSVLGGSDYYGSAVSLDGNMLAVGAERDDGAGNASADSGGVYLYTFADSVFNTATLQATMGYGYTGGKNIDVSDLEAGDRYGHSVSLDSNRLAVGSELESGAGNVVYQSGAARLYTFSDNTFSGGALQSIVGAGYTGGKNINLSRDFLMNIQDFWSNVALDGNRLLLGGYSDEAFGLIGNSGSVAMFTFTDSAFSGGQLAGLNGNGYTSGKNFSIDPTLFGVADAYGNAVSLNNNRLAVGVQADDGVNDVQANAGAVFLYSIPSGDYDAITLESIIGHGYTGGKNINMSAYLEQNDSFGSSVSLDNNRLAVGAFQDDASNNNTGNAGAVYLFSFDDSAFTNGTLQSIIGSGYVGAKDINLPLGGSDYFGWSVSLDGNRLAVGAQRDDGNANVRTDSGAVYLFTFSDSVFSGGTLAGTIGYGYTGPKDYDLSPLDNSDYFGSGVSLDGNRLAVGSPNDDGVLNDNVNAGAAYLFTFADAAFSGAAHQGTIGYGYSGPKDVSIPALFTSDVFGYSIALDGTVLAVGTPNDQGYNVDTGGRTGAIYLYTFSDLSFSNPIHDSVVGRLYTGGKNIDVNIGGNFGYAISLDSGVLVAGASATADVRGQYGATGRVYIWRDSLSPVSTATSFASLASNTVGITASALANLLSTPQNVTLQASNDITIASPIFVSNSSGDGGTLTLQAGRSILINAPIITDNGDLNLIANEDLADGVINALRDAGTAAITMGSGVTINAGSGSVVFTMAAGTGKTYSQAGHITLETITANDIQIIAETQTGNIITNGVLTATGGGDAILLAAGANYTNNYGAGALVAASGRWLVYADHEDYTDLNGLVPDITGNSCIYNGACSVTPGPMDNAVLYEYRPHLLSVSINASRQYGDANPNLAALQALYNYSGFENGDDASVLNVLPTATIASSASSSATAGSTHAITLSGGSDDYYDYYFLDGLLTIDKKDITATWNGTLSKTYGNVNPTVNTADFTYVGLANGQNNSVITANADYGAIDGTTGAGTYNIGAAFSASNYNVTNSPQTTLTILKRDITAAWTGTLARIYGDANPTVNTGNFTYTGMVNGDTNAAVTAGADFLGTTSSTAVSTVNVNGTFSSANYNVTNTPVTTMAISKRDISATVHNDIRAYGDANPAWDWSDVTWNNLANSETGSVLDALTLSVAGTATATAAAGSMHAISLTGFSDNNYNLTGYTQGTLTIAKRDITAAVHSDTRIYGDANPVWDWSDVTWNNLANSEDGSVLDALTVSSAAGAASNAGSAQTIVLSGFSDNNYNLTGFTAGALTISKRDITANVGNTSRAYGGTGTNATWADVTWNNLVNGNTGADMDTLTFAAPTANAFSAAGTTHTLDIGGFSDNNYNLTGTTTGLLTINQAPVNVVARNAQRVEGEANPPFFYDITGLKNSDLPTVFTGILVASTASGTSGPGPYAITPSAGAAANYYIDQYIDGILTVTPAPIDQIPNTVAQTLSGSFVYAGSSNTMASPLMAGPVDQEPAPDSDSESMDDSPEMEAVSDSVARKRAPGVRRYLIEMTENLRRSLGSS